MKESKFYSKDYSGQLDDEVFSSSAITQDHYLNITGGNDKSTFASSLGDTIMKMV